MVKTLALVLKKQNIGETDRIITIFSPNLGKKRIIARAVRKPLSKLAGHLDTLMLSQLMLTDEPDLPKVTSAVLVESFEEIRSSLALTNRALALSRIVERVIIEDVSQRPIFQLTVEALSRLTRGSPWPAIWLFFLARLAISLGLGLTSYQCHACGQIITGDCRWQATDRRFSCASCPAPLGSIAIEKNSLKLLMLLAEKQFATIETIAIPRANARQVEQILLEEITAWLHKPWHHYAEFYSPTA